MAKPAPAAELAAEERAAPAEQAPAKAARGVKRGAPKGAPRRGAAAQQHKRAPETYKARPMGVWRCCHSSLVAQAEQENYMQVMRYVPPAHGLFIAAMRDAHTHSSE